MSQTSATPVDTTRPVDRIDFIDRECALLGTILRGQAVTCKALAHASEADDGIGNGDLQHALACLSEVIASLEPRIRAIQDAADALFDTVTAESAAESEATR
jgi:hypothetical protein